MRRSLVALLTVPFFIAGCLAAENNNRVGQNVNSDGSYSESLDAAIERDLRTSGDIHLVSEDAQPLTDSADVQDKDVAASADSIDSEGLVIYGFCRTDLREHRFSGFVSPCTPENEQLGQCSPLTYPLGPGESVNFRVQQYSRFQLPDLPLQVYIESFDALNLLGSIRYNDGRDDAALLQLQRREPFMHDLDVWGDANLDFRMGYLSYTPESEMNDYTIPAIAILRVSRCE